MVDKIIRIILVFALGWFFGYLHHYYSIRGASEELRLELERLEQEFIEFQDSVKRVKTTAYSNDPISINVPRWRDGVTATGSRARRGSAAADWSVFPPGTRLYIPSYGEGWRTGEAR